MSSRYEVYAEVIVANNEVAASRSEVGVYHRNSRRFPLSSLAHFPTRQVRTCDGRHSPRPTPSSSVPHISCRNHGCRKLKTRERSLAACFQCVSSSATGPLVFNARMLTRFSDNRDAPVRFSSGLVDSLQKNTTVSSPRSIVIIYSPITKPIPPRPTPRAQNSRSSPTSSA